ncbi:MAG: hypothetical protein NC087_04585 [Anaeroplasma bactoclasticum]|nr:hypothetical protein [Anaeroplasma bactoclasticum]
MKKEMYYLDKQFKAGYRYYSYDEGAFDDKHFETYDEAEEYACDNAYRIDENEAFLIVREEVED